MRTAFYWFRNDLRLHDNPSFKQAIESFEKVIPLYVLDHAIALRPYLGFERFSPYRKAFLKDSLLDLKEALQCKGSDLIVMEGNVDEVFNELRKAFQCDVVCSPGTIGTEEEEQEALLMSAGFTLIKGAFNTLFQPDQLPFALEQLPSTFTPFRKKIERLCEVAPPQPEPETLPPLNLQGKYNINEIPFFQNATYSDDSRTAFPFFGGLRAAKERLHKYLWQTDHVAKYKHTRNGLIGAEYSSKLSAWLALGCISPREIVAELQRYEAQRTKNESTYWLFFELLWREYFQFNALLHGKHLFLTGGFRRMPATAKMNHDGLEKWMLGSTADPFVNANMLELSKTGFMSNRGRQNAASYLINDLQVDWRFGAAHFESMLIDFDAASNYGNWQYLAGVGNDPKPDRYFNTKKQAAYYDPNGSYQQLWLRG